MRAPERNRQRAAIAFIFVTLVLDVLAIGIIVPVLPKLVVSMAGGDTVRGAELYGMFGTVWAAMQFLCSPLLGALSDRFGRRPIILLSNLGLGLGYVLVATAPSLGWLLVARVVSGITAASFSTASAYIADVTPPEKRAAGFGMLGAAFGLGFVLGPALGGMLGNNDPRLPFWIAAGLSFTNALYGFFVLPESLSPERRSPFTWRRANPIGSIALLRSDPALLGLATVGFLQRLAHDVLPSTFVLYTTYRFGWGVRTVGLWMAAGGICGMIVSGTLVQPIVGRFGERRVLLGALLCGAAAFATYGMATNSWVFAVGIPLQALWGLTTPTLQGLMTGMVRPSEQGQLQGAQTSLAGIPGMLGPGMFTQTFAFAINPLHTWQLPGAPFLLAAAMLLVGMIVARRVTPGRPRVSPA